MEQSVNLLSIINLQTNYINQMESKIHPVVLIDGHYNFICPHCEINVVVEKNELACKIFRCGIMKSNGEPVPPHEKKERCDELFNKGLIYGCGKPFRVVDETVVGCDYI